jgi:type VI secretion system protein ImpC
MEIVLYDVSAEELAADIAASEDLQTGGLYGMLVEQPALDAHEGALSVVIGLYNFELMPPHAELLGRIAQVAAACGAPFIAAIGPDALKIQMYEQHRLIQDSWSALRDLEAARYLGLATPRFLLRMPYGKKSDPIDAFAFEEFTRQGGLSAMLWGHAALIPALLLAETFAQQGLKMIPGGVMGVPDMVSYLYTDPDGEQVALPCTERMYGERQAVDVAGYGVMPLLSIRGRPELRLGSFASVNGPPMAGFWASVAVAPRAKPEPVAAAVAAPVVEAKAPEPAPSDSAEMDLDALLAGLTDDAPAEPATAAAAAEPEAPPPDDDLDALLASLNAPAEPAKADETEPDLDALLASLQ